ncbi:tetratricopeptide repeat protein [Streptomyces longwoodensis]|uniref:tetratricopeptide repeat protein n=1 Tax=Streptomyces longwoodensis TaxID=68231 RepID=UPI0033FA34A2
MPPQQTASPRWRDLVSRTAASRGYPTKIERALADPAQYSHTEKVPQLAQLLDGALKFPDGIAAKQLSGLMDLAFRVVLTVGAGSTYRGYEEFLEYALRLIEILQARGAPTTQLLLSAARFQACLANGDPLRRSLIERAVEAAQDTPDHVIARLHLARFHIDISDYTGARRHVAQCRAALGAEQDGPLGPDLETTAGITHYYIDPKTARGHFEAAVNLGQRYSEHPAAIQPIATALHYLGRLAADRGEYQLALEYFVHGERQSDDYLTRHGFYHQRLAEILTDHGSAGEAEYHLCRAEETFARVGQVSNGLTLLQGSWARWYLRQGDFARAERNLTSAIQASRRENAPRVELILQAELLRLHLRQRTLSGALRVLARAGILYLTGESINSRRHVLQQARTIAAMTSRFLRPKPIPPNQQPVSCPCGANHTTQPTTTTTQ